MWEKNKEKVKIYSQKTQINNLKRIIDNKFVVYKNKNEWFEHFFF